MRVFFLVVSFLLLSISTEAAHIIGGEITYECLGDDRYRFTMRIYRDCASGGADFDGPGASINAASITIFRGFSEFETLYLGAPTVTSIAPDLENPCLIIPPGVCVQEGVYVFEATLPNSDQSYSVTYQRCCRNSTINNIINPGETGATYTVEITPDAQDSCNNSPVFNNFPPIVICAGLPLTFDHSATDAEGDQLVYEFCSPFLGGGTGGSTSNSLGAAFLLDGVAPDPDAPPAYIPVDFIVPTYSATFPMGSPSVAPDPVVINPVTGLITGTPDILGQFVVGVCVKEFRNGVLLSTVRRDFQFNVTTCEPQVNADIVEDEIINGDEFLINSCGNNTVLFENESRLEQFIDEYYWIFDLNNGTTDSVVTWDATVTFPDTGLYVGHLFLNPGTDCADTATIYVNVYPDITSSFTYSYDTCVAGPVSFFDLSTTGSGLMTDWQWLFGDGNSSTEVNPVHTYDSPGTKEVTLLVTDINGCEEALTQPIFWVPAPAEVIVEPSTFLGCTPANIFFNNLSTPIDETYDILWDFGDGTSSTEISPTHIYENPGTYSITLDITSPIGCYIGAEYPNWITVRESPTAGFSFSPDNPSNLEPEVSFTDESLLANEWDWFFGTEGYSNETDPVYSFQDTGFYEVVQIVTHINGCQDTAILLLDVEPVVKYFLPNAFTPNSDGTNDFYAGVGVFDGMVDFELTIWNRWGEKVFETNDPNEKWNGQKNNTGRLSPGGVYVVLARYINPRGELIDIKTYATLIR